ncbi:hypothetical protein [Actinomadura hibisca]|uniref:hypothetical protein n=1 Tax=Actinomadura hibisca TaxID=68565 RepID=UPI000832989A|nr:hypothetical protein [Actinomadura hibisca]
MTGFTAVVSGGTTITARGAVRAAAERVLGRLWIDQVPVRLASEDAELWPSAAAAAAGGRALCWPGQPGPARALLERIAELRARARAAGLTEVVLVGAGPAVRAAALVGGSSLTVLDGPEPGPPARLAADRDRLSRTLVVLAGPDPAGGALYLALHQMMADLGLSPTELAERFVAVAEPGCPTAGRAVEGGHALVEAPAATAFGALSPYALVPAGLAGADVAGLLDRATAVLPALTRPENNPGLVLGAILGGCARAGRTTVVLGGYPAVSLDLPPESSPGLAEWVAALLAEATGGLMLPLVQRGGLPVRPAGDVFLITLDGRPKQDDATVTGPLAEQLVMWEYAAAVAAYLLDADPLAPPRHERPAEGAADEADTGADTGVDSDAGTAAEQAGDGPPVFVEGDPGQGVEVHTADPALAAAKDLAALLAAVADRVAGNEHLAVAAFLDPDEARGQGAQVRRLAGLLAARCARPVTVTWGCRYPAFGNDRQEKGVYLVVTGNAVRDVPVPERRHGLDPVQRARAAGAARAARAAGRPVVRLHLHDRRAGLARLLESARGGA